MCTACTRSWTRSRTSTEFGNGDHMASARNPLDWFRLPGGHAFLPRLCAGQSHLDPELLLGWRQESRPARADDEPRHVAESWRRRISGTRPDTPWAGRTICQPGRRFFPGFKLTRRLSTCRGARCIRWVFISPRRREIIYADEFIRSYQGILILLMQKHREFQVVTPRTLANFKGETLVLPDVRIFS